MKNQNSPGLIRLAQLSAPLLLLMFSPLPLVAQEAPPEQANKEARRAQADKEARREQAKEAARREQQAEKAKPPTAAKGGEEIAPAPREANRDPERAAAAPERGAGAPGRPAVSEQERGGASDSSKTESSQPDRNRRPNRGQPDPSASDRGDNPPATGDSAPGRPGRPPRAERPEGTDEAKKARERSREGSGTNSPPPRAGTPPTLPGQDGPERRGEDKGNRGGRAIADPATPDRSPGRPPVAESPDVTPPPPRRAAAPETTPPGAQPPRENGRPSRAERAGEANKEEKPKVRPEGSPPRNPAARPGDQEPRPGKGNNQVPSKPGKPDVDDNKPGTVPPAPTVPGAPNPTPPVPLPNPPIPTPPDPTPPMPTPPAPTPPDPTPPVPLPKPPVPTPPVPTPPVPKPPVPTPQVPTPGVDDSAKPATPGTPPAGDAEVPKARRGDDKGPNRPNKAPADPPSGEKAEKMRKPGQAPASPDSQAKPPAADPAAVPPGDPRTPRETTPNRGDRAPRERGERPGEAVPVRPADIVTLPEVRQAETEVRETTRKIERDLRKTEIKGAEQAQDVINQILGAGSAISRAEIVREERVRPRLDATRSRHGGREAYSVAPPAQRTEAVQYFQRRLRGEAMDAPPPAFFQHYDSYREDDGYRDDNERGRPGEPGYPERRPRGTATETHTETVIEHHRPRYLREGRRYVHYESREAIPAILLAGEALNRVQIQPAQELTGYYQTSGSTRQDAPPAPETYRAETSVVVSYPVNEKSMISSGDILFQQGSTQFADPFSYEIVAALAEAMKEMPDEVRFAIEGHASGEGSYESNMVLSQQRAERIVREMVRSGVSPNRLLPVGYGESEARQPAGAAENLRMKDRRVVVFRMDEQLAAR